MDTSKLISQAEYARKQKCSPQWISQLIEDNRLEVTRIGKIDYILSSAKIKPKKKKKSTKILLPNNRLN